MKTIFFILALMSFSLSGFSQTTTRDSLARDTAIIKDTSLRNYKYLERVEIADSSVKRNKIRFRPAKKMYRPTRLGSSSPKYDTYEKNKRGAGAITTNPNKSGTGTVTLPPVDSTTTRKDSIPIQDK